MPHAYVAPVTGHKQLAGFGHAVLIFLFASHGVAKKMFGKHKQEGKD
jgi:hypothetical protein